MLCTAPLLSNGPSPLPPTEMYVVTHSLLHLRTPSETLPRGIFVTRSKIRHHSNAVIVDSCRTAARVSCSWGKVLCVSKSQWVIHLTSEIVMQCFPTSIPHNIFRGSFTSREKFKISLPISQ
jgi:hypothetical protein